MDSQTEAQPQTEVEKSESFYRYGFSTIYRRLLNTPPQKQELEDFIQRNQQGGAQNIIEDIALGKAYANFLETTNVPREMVIESLYKDILGRNADVDGRTFYIDSGMSLIQIRDSIMASSEFKEKNQVLVTTYIVERIYKELLKRPVDEDGLQVYRDQLNAGRNPEDIKRELAKSEEFTKSVMTEVSDNREEAVKEIYRRIFGREGNEKELNLYITSDLPIFVIRDNLVSTHDFSETITNDAIPESQDGKSGEEINTLITERDKAQQEVEQLQKQLRNVLDHVGSLQGDLTRANDLLKDTTRQIALLKQEVEQARNARRPNGELQTALRELGEAQARIIELEDDNRVLTNQWRTAEGDTNRLKNDLSKARRDAILTTTDNIPLLKIKQLESLTKLGINYGDWIGLPLESKRQRIREAYRKKQKSYNPTVLGVTQSEKPELFQILNDLFAELNTANQQLQDIIS